MSADTPAAEREIARPRRRISTSPPRSALPRQIAQAVLFLCGMLCWIATPKYAKGDFAFTISPLQAAIPLIGIVVLGIMLVHYGTRFPRTIRPSAASRWLMAGCGFIFFGAAVHIQGGPLGQDTIVYLARWTMPLFAVLILWFLISLGGTIPTIFYGLIVGAAISCIGVILSRSGVNLPTGFSGEGRASGFTAHPNQYGIIASGTAPFLVYFLQSRRGRQQLLGLVALGIWGLVLFQALSKTNLLLFPVALVLTFFATSLNRKRAFARSFIIVGCLSVLLAGLAVGGLQLVRELSPRDAQIMENTFEDPLNAKTIQQRESAWEEVFEYLQRNPLLGMGPGWGESNLMLTHAHNLYVQIYVDAGLAGFIGILCVTLAVLMRTRDALRAIVGIGDRLTEADRIQVMAGIALIISLLGNSMSSSLSTGTMTVFSVLLGIAFVRPQTPREG